MKSCLLVALILISNISSAQTASELEKWYVPDHLKLQFAGNIGFLSVGTGYVHGKDRFETDILLGFLPQKIGGDDITSLTGKLTFFPWRTVLNEKFELLPFSLGTHISYSFGSQFDTILPNVYPKGYYWWASSLRLGGFIGGQLQVNQKSKAAIKSVKFYYELGSYDLKFISYFQNREYLGLDDIISLALGLTLHF